MARLLGKTRALAASLALAGAAMFNTAASAQYVPGGPCWESVVALCNANYQAWGYANASDCANHEWCYFCSYGYMCGFDPRQPYYGLPRPYTGTAW